MCKKNQLIQSIRTFQFFWWWSQPLKPSDIITFKMLSPLHKKIKQNSYTHVCPIIFIIIVCHLPYKYTAKSGQKLKWKKMWSKIYIVCCCYFVVIVLNTTPSSEETNHTSYMRSPPQHYIRALARKASPSQISRAAVNGLLLLNAEKPWDAHPVS